MSKSKDLKAFEKEIEKLISESFKGKFSNKYEWSFHLSYEIHKAKEPQEIIYEKE